ncbi:DUF3593 domain-containing protein [Prochlorococcus marinus]|uniref:DUF3593 domain-containing protein n=1 Tax=Prochlorococcus marinus TaxID=1219 RepID=UPI0022B532D5|nr:DUF3593 domain-containing protein [Prochlorococcus marinus]
MNNPLLFFNELDPGPIFVISLFPYLVFLYWAQKSKSIPLVSLWGFRLTLLFVGMTIIFSIIAALKYGQELTDVDYLHGSAEAFLTLSDGLVVLGFAGLLSKRGE